MIINWIQGDISDPMDTNSYVVTIARHSPLVDTVTRNHPEKLTQ